jgi:hypothetical protein
LVAAFSPISPEIVRRDMSAIKYSTDLIRDVATTLKLLPSFLARASNLDDVYLRTLALTVPNIVQYLFHYAHVYLPSFNMYEAEERYGKLSDELKQNPIPVTGNDLIAMGMKPSPEFKQLISAFKQLYIKNPRTPKEDYLKLVNR